MLPFYVGENNMTDLENINFQIEQLKARSRALAGDAIMSLLNEVHKNNPEMGIGSLLHYTGILYTRSYGGCGVYDNDYGSTLHDPAGEDDLTILKRMESKLSRR